MRQRYRIATEHAICLAVLAILPLLLLVPSILRGHAPVSTQSTLSMLPWEEARPTGEEPADSPEQNLAAQRYFPWYAFIASVQSVGDVLWSPLEYAGLPFFAMWRTRCLSPFTFPFYLGDPVVALRVSLYLKLLLAGLCAFYAARRLGHSPAIALFAAASFELSGPLLVWSVYPVSDVMPWFPLLLLYAERLALGHYRAWPGGALALALSLVPGDHETVIAAVLFSLFYFAFRSWHESRRPADVGASLGLWALSAAVAAGLCAVQWVPYAEFMRFRVQSVETNAAHALSLTDWSAWLFPYAIPVSGLSPDTEAAARGASLLHVGTVAVVLLGIWPALRAFAAKRQRGRAEALAGCAVVWIALAILIERPPVSTSIAGGFGPEHFLPASIWALTLLAAATMEEWLHLGVHEVKSTIKRLVFTGTLVWGASVGITVMALRSAGGIPPTWAILLAAALAALTLVVLGVTMISPSSRVQGYSLCGIAVFDLLATFAPIFPATPLSLLYPETPFVAMLKKSGGRVTGSESLDKWPLAGNLVPQLYGSAGVLLKHQADFRAAAIADPLLLRRSGSQLLLLTQEDIQGKFAPIRSVLRVEHVLPTGAVLFFDTEAQTSAWMAYQARLSEKYAPELLNGSEPPLLEQGTPPPPLPEGKAPGTVTIVPDETTTRVTVQLDGVSKGVLVLADAYYPGWKANVDGEAARVFPVDVLFRGVEVPEGAGQVVFQFDPPLVELGALISGVTALGLLIAAGVLAPSTIKRFREKNKWSF